MTTSTHVAIFAATFAALYVSHHVGDYWIQTDHQANHKGAAGHGGRVACLKHVSTYLATQLVALLMLCPLGVRYGWTLPLALAISGVTHYMADRREHGLMFKLARRLPGKANFLQLGVPRKLRVDAHWVDQDVDAVLDNPSLGTGAWALDQSWHIFWGVFVAALVIAA